MDILRYEDRHKLVDSVLIEMDKLDKKLINCQGYDLARDLSIQYLALIDSIDMCILSSGESIRTAELELDLLYSKLLSDSGESSESGKKRYADNNTEYIKCKSEVNKLELFLNYLNNFRDGLKSKHDLTKLIYKNEVLILQLTPKI